MDGDAPSGTCPLGTSSATRCGEPPVGWVVANGVLVFFACEEHGRALVEVMKASPSEMAWRWETDVALWGKRIPS